MVVTRIDEQNMARAQVVHLAPALHDSAAFLNKAEDVVGMKMPGKGTDNALEAVMRVDKSRRIVGLTIKSEGGLVSVTLSNYFDGNIDLSGGLPKTTKEDAALHGYGVRSIKDIVEKYGGDMYISTKGGIFSLNMLFMPPAPQARQNA